MDSRELPIHDSDEDHVAEHVAPNPDVGGVFRKRDGKNFFVRLWPAPVFLEEQASRLWSHVNDIKDDFNHTILVEMRDEIAERCRADSPSLVEAILNGHPPQNTDRLCSTLRTLFRLQQRIEVREQILGRIPSDVLRQVRQYPEEHFQLLRFFASHPQAMEMAQSNVLLTFLVATHERWRGKSKPVSADFLDIMLRRKRADILEWLGFDHAGRGLARFMAKVSPWACRTELVLGLRENLRDARILRRVRHLGRLNLGAAAIASDRELLAWASYRLLHEVSEDRQEDRLPATARQLRAYGLLHKSTRLHIQQGPFDSRRKLQHVLSLHVENMMPEEIDALALSFPPPPIHTTPQIRALRTPEAVFEEACGQGNCVWSLLPRLASGKLFAYRVLTPERATLTIRYRRDQWEIDELEAALNHPASPETWQYVEHWLTTSDLTQESGTRNSSA